MQSLLFLLKRLNMCDFFFLVSVFKRIGNIFVKCLKIGRRFHLNNINHLLVWRKAIPFVLKADVGVLYFCQGHRSIDYLTDFLCNLKTT